MKLFPVFIVAGVLTCCSTWTYAERHSFITKHGPIESHSALLQRDVDLFKTVNKGCTVVLSKEILSPTRLVKGDEILFNLPDGINQIAVVDHISTDVMGITTVRGRFTDDPLGYLLISTDGSTLLADVSLPDKKIRRSIKSKKGVHYLVEPDAEADKPLEGAPSLAAPQDAFLTPSSMASMAAAVGGSVSPLANGVGDPATIDIMVAYTPAAKTWATASGGGISNVINQLMAQAQLACDNSQTFITMRLVHAPEISYTESGDAGTDLDRLTDTDGFMDDIHALRTTYGADLVVLLESLSSTGGIGWLLNYSSGLPTLGFSISRVQQASWSFTTIHEIGHNMGCGHHKLQNTQPGPGLYSYSAGWRWTYNTSHYCSVMTYESGTFFADGITHTRVAYFSDPAISLNGLPTGNATNGNNALTLRQVKHTIAAYRAATVNVVAAPQFSPVSGTTFLSSTNVSISCATTGATIRYTTNGTEPTTNSTQYATPFTLTRTTTVQAKAFKSGMTDSTTAVATYTSLRPPNDNFINALTLSGASGATMGTNTFATKEVGEPSHATVASATNSVWWKWTAPSTGFLRVDTLRTSFDTVMAAYTGSSVNALTAIASNDDFNFAGGIYQSLISFTATSNTTYSIAVSGYNGATGAITLNWILVPWSSITTLQNGVPVSATGSKYSNAYFKIAVPAGASNLVITTSGGTAGQNCNLYVLYGTPAATNVYNYVSQSSTSTEQVNVITPTLGDWHILLNGYAAYSGVTLRASYAQNTPVINTATFTSSPGSTNLVIQFDGNAGRTYNILRKYALTNLNWTTIGTHTPTTNKLTTLQITITPGHPSGFYRLQMQ